MEQAANATPARITAARSNVRGSAALTPKRRLVSARRAVGALLMGPDGGFTTGSDFLMDGGVTAA